MNSVKTLFVKASGMTFYGPARIVLVALLFISLPGHQAWGYATPEQDIGGAVQQLLDEFTSRREELKKDKEMLYQMVDDITRPYFDFDKISKLILAKNWKAASDRQRKGFSEEFQQLLIRTYATALFKYTGKEKMKFTSSKIKDRKGTKSATLESEVTLSEGPGIPVNYSLILGDDDIWKIYNMNIAGINLVTNYRKVYGASIRSMGLDALIQSMKDANSKI